MTHPHYRWTFDPAQLVLLAIYVVVYVRRFMHAREEAGGRGAGLPQFAAFVGAVVVLLVALVSPVDALGDSGLASVECRDQLLDTLGGQLAHRTRSSISAARSHSACVGTSASRQ